MIPRCFWCGKLKNEIALFGKYGGGGEDLEAPMGVFLDYEPCDECVENQKLGVTLIEATGKPNFENQPEIQNGIFPTGKWCVIRRDAAERIFSDQLNRKDKVFVDQELFETITGGVAEE